MEAYSNVKDHLREAALYKIEFIEGSAVYIHSLNLQTVIYSLSVTALAFSANLQC